MKLSVKVYIWICAVICSSQTIHCKSFYADKLGEEPVVYDNSYNGNVESAVENGKDSKEQILDKFSLMDEPWPLDLTSRSGSSSSYFPLPRMAPPLHHPPLPTEILDPKGEVSNPENEAKAIQVKKKDNYDAGRWTIPPSRLFSSPYLSSLKKRKMMRSSSILRYQCFYSPVSCFSF